MSVPTQAPMRPAPAAPRRRRGLWLALAAVVALAAAVAALLLVVGGRDAEPADAGVMSVRGSLTLSVGDFTVLGSGSAGMCAGTGGYDDVAVGAAVTVTDAGGTVVALGKLHAATPGQLETVTGDATEVPRPLTCVLSFRIDNVPAGRSFYGIEVSHRGAVKYDEAALAAPVQLSLG